MSSAYAGRPDDSGEPERYMGQRLGLPERGRGSLASWGQRILALIIDWAASTLVAIGIFGLDRIYGPASDRDVFVLVIYFVEATLLTSLIGGSFGQSVLRIGVVSIYRRPLHIVLSIVRHLLILLVIPAVIWDRDRRGLHDLAARSVVVRR